ncbi:MAG TPA: serine hydrolase domain-containing protein, partial [Myxococcaceae bacterium]|nr:serine hydrolase domain-containing protein [Myxococcaceae bacterium]
MSSPRKSPYAEGPGANVVLHGTVAPGFEEVREEFRRNFTERNELGASCAVYFRGQKVVDLWGGWKDASTREPWQEDTCALVFSTTKGMAAITAAVAHSRGWLDYDAPVAAYWPEFAQAGKG